MSETANKTSGRGWILVIVAWTAVFLVNLANFALGMLLPSMREELNFGIEVAGQLSATAWIIQAFVTIPIALLVAKINPKYVLGILYLITGVALIMQGVASNLAMIFIGRALVSGASAGLLAPLVLIKINWFPQDKLAQLNGIENFIAPVGQAMGTAAVGYLLVVLSGWRTLMMFMGVVALAVAAIWFLTYKEKEGAEFKKSDAPFLEPLKEALKLKEVWLLALGWPGTSLVWIATYTFWPTYATESLNLTLDQAGLILGLLPIASAIASLVSPTITKWIGYDKLMIWPWGFILPVCYFTMLKTSNIAILCLASFMAGFGAYAFVPIAFTTLYKLPGVKPRTVSLGVSCIITMVSVGASLGDYIAGALGETVGLYNAMAICCLSPLIFGVLTLFLPELGRKYEEKKKKAAEAK